MKKNINKLLHDTYVNRIAEIIKIIDFNDHSGETINSWNVNENAEECLRIIMVKMYPCFKLDDDKSIQKCIHHLLSIRKEAVSSDLRYIDAYNNCFEKLSHDPNILKKYSEFCITYLLILKKQIEQLEGMF